MKKIKATFPRNRARRYQAYLLATLKDYHAYIRRVLFERLDTLNPNANRDAWGQDLAVIMASIEAYNQAFPDEQRVQEEAERVAKDVTLARDVARLGLANTLTIQGAQEAIRGFTTFGVQGAETQIQNRSMIQAWAIENTRLIKKMRTDEKQDIAGIVTRGFTQGASVRQVKNEIVEQFAVTQRRAKLIAQNELGNLAGALEKAEAERIGIEMYEWLTSNDERVRPSHRKMNGKICRWDDPTVYKDSLEDTVWKSRSSIGGVEKHPSMDIRCRCTSASIIDD